MAAEDDQAPPAEPVGIARTPVAGLLAYVVFPAVSVAAAIVGVTLIGHLATDYYLSVSFLIPSLLIALAVQGQFFRLHYVAPPPMRVLRRYERLSQLWNRLERAAAIAVLGSLACGEFAALYVLASGESEPTLFGITVGAITNAFVALGAVALDGAPDHS